MGMVKQRQVYWVDLEKVFPKDKHYQKGIRPCLIVSDFENGNMEIDVALDCIDMLIELSL